MQEAVARRPTIVISLALAITALVATLSNAPGRYIGDNRFEQYWAPGGRILREASLWDGSRGIGRIAEEFWPSSMPIGFLRGIGLSPAIAERLWHTSILVLAGVAVVHLVKVFLPRVGAVHAIAAFGYVFNPFTAVFLLPSVLFWNYAIAPLILLAFLRGVREPRAWRWPAVIALAVFAAGNADLPGTAYVLALLVPAALYVGLVARTASGRDIFGFLGRAALVTALCSAAALTKTAFGSSSLEARLAATELPRRVNVTSSWSESWRGLGFWLSYFGDADDLGRLPGGRYYWESVAGVLATFMAPLAAMVAVVWTRWRPRWLFVGLALTSLVLMVGSFPPDDPSPLGRAILWTFENVAPLSSLRNTYKAGAGLVLAVAVLLAVLAGTASRRMRGRSPAWSLVPHLGAAGIIVVSALPFVNGGLYPENGQLEAVPGYWEEALRFIDDQPGEGRVLVLPGTTKTAYRWGWPGDDIFDAHLHRHPNVISNAFPLSAPLAASAIDAIDEQVAAGTIAPGTIASVARRLGITQVVVRNDLDWERSQVRRPSELDLIRDDPTLVPAATFGEPGENVVAEDDDSVTARFEEALPPVEVYDVTTAPGPIRAQSAPPPAVASGDGAALASIGAADAVEDGRPIRFSAELRDDELREAVRGGGPVVITDTNRRRVVRLRGAVPTVSETVGPDQDLDQPPGDLWEVPGSQTVAVHPDADEVSATSSGVRLVGYQPWLRPANAFDGDPSTSWLTGGLEDPIGNRIRVDLREESEVWSVVLRPFRPSEDGRAVTEARLHFSVGQPIDVAIDEGAETTVTFPARRTDRLEVEITGVSRSGEAAVGFREIEVPGLELDEAIRLPEDLFVRAETDAALADALADAPTTYLFERRVGRGDIAEESGLRRRFQSLQAGPTVLEGSLSLDRDLGDEELSKVLAGFDGTEVVSWGSSRFNSDLTHRGELATDGDRQTAWGVRPQEDEALTVAFPRQAVDEVTVRSLGADAAELFSVEVVVAGRPTELELDPAPTGGCAQDACPRAGVLSLPEAVSVEEIEVRVGRVGSAENQPVRIAEVGVGGPDGPVDAGPRRGGACAEGLLAVDGSAVPIVVAEEDRDALGDGLPTPFTACPAPVLAAGTHELESSGPLLDRVSLSLDAEAVVPVQSLEPSVEILERTPDRLRIVVDAPEPAWVGTGQSFDPGWTASVEGEDLGDVVPLDGQSAWPVEAGRHVVEMSFAPARRYRLALTTTVIAVLVCLALVARPRRRGRP